MKKLILVFVLGSSLVACAGEPQIVVVTSTPVQPTITPVPTTSIRDRGLQFPSASGIVTGAMVFSTSAPKPTELPLSTQYANYLLERGFEYVPENDLYSKQEGAGRGRFLAAARDDLQMVGYSSINPTTQGEIYAFLAHLEEMGEFLDPGHGYANIQSALNAIVFEEENGNEFPYGSIWTRGARGVDYQVVWLGTNNSATFFTFLVDDRNTLK